MLVRYLRSRRGNISMISALLMAVLAGLAGLVADSSGIVSLVQ